MSRRRKVAFPVNGHARNRVTSKIKATFKPGRISLDAESIVTTTNADARIVEVVVETPKGSHNKLKYDPKRAAFRLSHVLPIGMTFPFDFGFLPDTAGGDGDPLDVLVLHGRTVPHGVPRRRAPRRRPRGRAAGEDRRGRPERPADRRGGDVGHPRVHTRAHGLASRDPHRDRSLLRPIQPARRGSEFQVLHRRGSQAAFGVAARAAVRGPVGSP